jgi:hypothetical protein
MTKRRLTYWIESYVHFTRHDEAPENYHKFTALAILSAAVNRNCWMDRGYTRIFPNLYILFVGPGGIGKSAASAIGIEVLRESGLKVGIFTEFLTPNHIIAFMHKSTVRYKIGDKFMRKTPVLVYARDLGTQISEKIGVREVALLLAELFNKPGSTEEVTPKRDMESLHNPSLTFLAGCPQDWLELNVHKPYLRATLLGHMLIVKEDYARHRNSFTPFSKEDIRLREDLIHDLRIIGNLYGEVSWNDKVQKDWKKWYLRRDRLFETDHSPEMNSFVNRRPEFAQRLAMLSSMSRDSSLIVIPEDLIFALETVELCEHNIRHIRRNPVKASHMERLMRIIASRTKTLAPKLPTVRDIKRYAKFIEPGMMRSALSYLIQIGFCRIIGNKILLEVYKPQDIPAEVSHTD